MFSDTPPTVNTPTHGSNQVHLEVSFDDYINNNFTYKTSYDLSENIFGENGSLTNINEIINNSSLYKGLVINDIDDTYVSINDTSAPETIEVDGKTYYKYETYITNEEGIANISIPNDEDLDYIVKEIEVPEGCNCKTEPIKLDLTSRFINLEIITEPEPVPEEPNPTTEEEPTNKVVEIVSNPNTSTGAPIISLILLIISITTMTITIILKKKLNKKELTDC